MVRGSGVSAFGLWTDVYGRRIKVLTGWAIDFLREGARILTVLDVCSCRDPLQGGISLGSVLLDCTTITMKNVGHQGKWESCC